MLCILAENTDYSLLYGIGSNLFSSPEHSAGNADGKYLWVNPVDVMEDADHLDYTISQLRYCMR